ncbi:ankyrin repeat domain-containing protein [Wolbachia endosymbiont (group B) of Villa cingulata]|uniref:ankyrin repeat domain-containing protein n=1 Tax=Wolbachia endosymbiont (group B) of Villa cingulata TaxID=3066157 RepID=UPI003342A51E
MPESVRNAVFSSKVCIKNIYQGEYLYAANKCFNYDTDRRMAFTWTPKNEKNDKFRWNIKPDGDNFYILNVAFNETLYAASNYFNYDNDRRMVFTWISGGRVARDVWKIEPDGDNCSIMNVELNEYLYAADYAKYDDDRRRVFTWIPGGKVMQGVWKIEDCGPTVRKSRSQSTGTGARDNNGVAFSFNQSIIEPPICNISVNSHFGENVDINSKDENGWTPLHLAAWKGQLNDTRSLVEKGADINAENIFGRKPIHIAAENNNKNIIEFFLSKGMSIDDVDRYGRTPLYCASWNGHLGVVKYLVDKGADVYTQDKGGKTPLNVAIDQKHDDVIKYLKQAQLNEQLLAAVQDSDFNKVKDLVSQGAILNAQNWNGWTPLHFAVSNNRLDMAKCLIDEGANINAKDKDGRTPLYWASWINKLDIAKYLVGKGANIDTKDNNGRTPLDEANSHTMREVFMQAHLDKELLLTIKSEKDLRTINDLIAKDIDDRTHGGFYYTWSGNLDTVEFLVSKDVSVNATDKYGCTLLHWAALKGHSDIAKFLVDKGANVNAKDILGRTPMHFAVMNNHKDIQDEYGRGPIYNTAESNDKEIIELFLMKGASINEVDKNGETPLHLASWDGHLDVLQHLINNRANIDAKDNNGKTPLDIARDKGHNNILKYLGEKLNQEKGKSAQRERRHLLSESLDSSDQPEIAASSGARPSSLINIVANTIVDAIKGISRFIYSPLKVELPGIPKKGSGYYNTARNPNKQYTSQFSSEVCMSNNIGLTFFLLQSFLDKKYPLPKMCSITPEEVLASTLNIIGEFEEILRKTAKQSGVLVKDVNFFKVYLDIAGHVRNERYSQMPNTLYSAAKEACPKNEKFLSILKGNIEKMLGRQQMINSNNQEQGIANVDNKIPLSSLNSIAVEPANNKGLKGVTYASQVA